MGFKFEISRVLSSRSDRVKSVDLHPTEPWVLTSLYNGKCFIWNHQTAASVSQIDASELPTRCAKWIARKQWVVTASDDLCMKVYNYNTLEKLKSFEAHTDYIRALAVHGTLSLVLSSSDDLTIKLWDWEKNWQNTMTYEGHTHYVMNIVWSPKDPNVFASASLDRTIKVWGHDSPSPHFTLEGHEKGVNCLDYYRGGDKPFLISGADDKTVKVWDYQTKSCVATLEGHTHNVTTVAFHPTLPVVLTGSEDATVRLWHSSTYRLENTLNYGMERVWGVSATPSSKCVALAYDEGMIVIKLGRDDPAVSMDASGKIIWSKHQEIQTANLKASFAAAAGPGAAGAEGDASAAAAAAASTSIADGERVPLTVKDLGTCEIYPQSLSHNRKGQFVAVCGDGEYVIYTALAWRNKSFGSALEFVWANTAGEYATRDAHKIKVFRDFKEHSSFKPSFSAEGIFGGALLAVRSSEAVTFYDWEHGRVVRKIDECPRGVYWNEAGEMVAICCDASFYLLRYNKDVVQQKWDQGVAPQEEGYDDAFEFLGEVPESVQGGHWVGDCFIFVNTQQRLSYCVGGEVQSIAHLDRPMTLLGYLAQTDRVVLIDKDNTVVSYHLVVSVLELQTLVVRGEMDEARAMLASGKIGREHHNRIARFLEQQGHREDAMAISQDPEHRFELAIALGKLDEAVAVVNAQQQQQQGPTDQKWRQIADLALAQGKLALADKCLSQAGDLAGLLLLRSSLADAQGLAEVAERAKGIGLHNLGFVCSALLGDSHRCLELLLQTRRFPEAGLFARTYCPSRTTAVVAQWKEELAKTSPKAASALADPEAYPNLFEGLADALAKEARAKPGARPLARWQEFVKAFEEGEVAEDGDARAEAERAEAEARARAEAEARARAEAEAEAEAEARARARARAEAEAAAREHEEREQERLAKEQAEKEAREAKAAAAAAKAAAAARAAEEAARAAEEAARLAAEEEAAEEEAARKAEEEAKEALAPAPAADDNDDQFDDADAWPEMDDE